MNSAERAIYYAKKRPTENIINNVDAFRGAAIRGWLELAYAFQDWLEEKGWTASAQACQDWVNIHVPLAW